jgi:hypothetical protein
VFLDLGAILLWLAATAEVAPAQSHIAITLPRIAPLLKNRLKIFIPATIRNRLATKPAVVFRTEPK